MSEPEDSSADVIRQVCAIPFRRMSGQLELCLITNRKKRWIYPKGIIDPGETMVESALKEAQEEAGLNGRILPGTLGTFDDAKWGAQLEITVVLMEVTSSADTWLEADLRERQWVPAEAALGLVGRPTLKEFTARAIERLNGTPDHD